jgi:hypothetical protein
MTSQIAGKLLDEFRGTQKIKFAHIIFTHNDPFIQTTFRET